MFLLSEVLVMKVLRWFVMNMFFASCLYFGAINDSFVYTIGLAMAWLAIVSTIFVFFHKDALDSFAKEGGFSVPLVVDCAFDAVIMYLLFTTGSLFTFVWYGASMGFSIGIRARIWGKS